jgi:hypothetical protein
MSLTNYENGVAIVKRLRTTALEGHKLSELSFLSVPSTSVAILLRILYLCMYKLHFFHKNLPSEIWVRLMHGIGPFDD